jgi:hypothetical protein
MLTTAGAAAASSPRAHVTPRTQLVAGQVVTVTGKGFPPDTQVDVDECNGNVMTQGASACYAIYKQVLTTRKGLVPATTFNVQTGFIGANGSCGTSRADRKCYMAIATGGATQYALTEIFFAVP